MNNSNFSANNFDSIDAEFGLTNNNINNKQEEITMDNNQQSSSEVMDSEAVSVSDTPVLNNNKTMVNKTVTGHADLLAMTGLNQDRFHSPVESLEAAAVAKGWVAVTAAERNALAEMNQLSFREITTSTYAWKLFTDRDLAIVKSSFADAVHAVVGKDLTRVNELEAAFGKHLFDEGANSINITDDGIFHGVRQIGKLRIEVAVDFNKGKIAYVAKRSNRATEEDIKVKDLRKFALISFYNHDQSVSKTGLYSVEDSVRIFWALVNRCFTFDQFQRLVNEMTAKLFIDSSEQQIRNGKDAYGVRKFQSDAELNERSREEIIEAHKISVIPVVSMDQKGAKTIFQKSTKKGKLNGSEYRTCSIFFRKFDEPVIIDKQAKKWLAYGNGARAAFVDLKDHSIVTANPTDKSSKLLNRMASHSFKQATNQSATYAGEGADYVGSNLQIAMKGGELVRTEGIALPTFISFGDFAANAGTIETNAAQSVVFEFDVPKTLTKEISRSAMAEDFLKDEVGGDLTESAVKHKIKLAIIEGLKAKTNMVLIGGDKVEVGGVIVIENDKHFPINIRNVNSVNDVTVNLLGRNSAGSYSTIKISIKGEASAVKKSPKLRGTLKKGTAFPTNTTIESLGSGEVMDWTMLLSSETLKGSAGMAELIANHERYLDSKVVWNAGELLINGVAVDVKTVLESLCDKYVITRNMNQEVTEHKLFAQAGSIKATETVRGFFSYACYSVEVSTADENAGYSSLGTNEQHIVSLFNSTISSNLHKWSKADLNRAEHLSVDYEFNAVAVTASDREEIAAMAALIKNGGTKQDMESLAKAYPNGVRFDGGGFNQVVPFAALLHFGDWVGQYPGSTQFNTPAFEEEESEEILTRNLCVEVFDFINTLNQSGDAMSDQEIRNLFTTLNGMRGWLSSIRSSSSNFVKVAKAGNKKKAKKFHYHLKVVGDTELGFDAETGLPVVELNTQDNPSGYRDGNKVLLSRCPLPLFTACIVRHNANLDSTVVAVNPMIWAVSNAGDNDGDIAYLTNLYLLNGGKNVGNEECRTFNNKYSGLAYHQVGDEQKFYHWEVFAKKEGELRPVSPIVGNLGEGKDQLEKFIAMSSKVAGAEFVNQVQEISEHYAMGVGEFHKVSSALTESLGNKIFSGEAAELSSDEVIALHKSWIDYEEFGLGGWTPSNGKVRQELKGNLQAEMQTPGCFRPKKRFGKSIATNINWLAIEAAAISEIGARAMNNQAGYDVKSLTAQALKRLTKKAIAPNEMSLWTELFLAVGNDNVLDAYRFGEHIKVLGRVRQLA